MRPWSYEAEDLWSAELNGPHHHTPSIHPSVWRYVDFVEKKRKEKKKYIEYSQVYVIDMHPQSTWFDTENPYVLTYDTNMYDNKWAGLEDRI